VATKVAIDQLAWNPIFGLMFFSYLGLAEGKNFTQIAEKIRNDLQTAVMGSWTVWIPAHFINFRFIPSEQRLLYINSIQIGCVMADYEPPSGATRDSWLRIRG
jgi:protein Mpv17